MADIPGPRRGEASGPDPERPHLTSETLEVLRLCGVINELRILVDSNLLPQRGRGSVQATTMFGREVVRSTISLPDTITRTSGIGRRQIIVGFSDEQPVHIGIADYYPKANRYRTVHCDTFYDPAAFAGELNELGTDTQLGFIGALRQLGVVMGVPLDQLYPQTQDDQQEPEQQ